MNYTIIYNSIINNAKTRNKLECYIEKHHIIPVCMGGSNHQSNKAVLTAREHFICHWLLTKIHPDKSGIWFGFMCMAFMTDSKFHKRDYKVSSKLYEKLKQIKSELSKGELNHAYGKPGLFTGKKHTQQSIDKMKLAQKGELHHTFKGYYITPEGKFSSPYNASKVTNANVASWCLNPNQIISKFIISKSTLSPRYTHG